jgi:dihydroorotase
VSTAGSVDVVRWAKKRGIAVTAEVTPHHLLLTDESAQNYDAIFKVNPPLRTSEDVEALRSAVADGTIDIIATDHAPHTAASKDSSWNDAPFGMVGLESALSIVQLSLVETGHLSWEGVARVMSVAPADIGRVAGYDSPLAVGSPANISLIDPSHSATWSRESLRGRSTNSPFVGRELPGRVIATIFNGTETVIDGMLVEPETVRNA